jgi:hypothetical protein
MPRRELLTPTERLQLLSFPEDKGELIRVVTLSEPDIAFVRQHRGDHNRFGIAVLMSYLRYPGRILAKDEKPHDVELLTLLGHEAILNQALQGALRVAGANSAADHARYCSGTSSLGGATKEAHRSSARGGHRTPLW